jgi:hypothetical protein
LPSEPLRFGLVTSSFSKMETQMRVYRTGADDELICDAGVAQPAGYEA